MDVHVREHPVPGAGRAFEFGLPDGSSLSIRIDGGTRRRELSQLRSDEDEPFWSLRLDAEHAMTLATLLSGVRVVFESEPTDTPAEGVHVESIVLGHGSPAVGRLLDDVEVLDPQEARILAVIRDDTPELIEDDETRTCEPGDRLVLAGRPAPLAALRAHLRG